jgi:hypothetical protein
MTITEICDTPLYIEVLKFYNFRTDKKLKKNQINCLMNLKIIQKKKTKIYME